MNVSGDRLRVRLHAEIQELSAELAWASDMQEAADMARALKAARDHLAWLDQLNTNMTKRRARARNFMAAARRADGNLRPQFSPLAGY